MVSMGRAGTAGEPDPAFAGSPARAVLASAVHWSPAWKRNASSSRSRCLVSVSAMNLNCASAVACSESGLANGHKLPPASVCNCQRHHSPVMLRTDNQQSSPAWFILPTDTLTNAIDAHISRRMRHDLNAKLCWLHLPLTCIGSFFVGVLA